MTALLAGVAVLAFGVKAGLPWWALVAVTLLTVGPAGSAGAQIGRRRGIRDEVLQPGERWSPPTPSVPRSPNTPRPRPTRARSINYA
ncbi:hypothetical protein [Streptomyces sp. NPDC058092]|uniref:hypothetical protein n=1 Tax=Streptomyces sp. NPDC058092 TaxID=3346336 RepID=UPI0036E1D067